MNSFWSKIRPWLGLVSVFLVGVLVGSVLTVMTLNKRQQEGGPRKGPEMFVNKLEEKLNLTPEQKEKIIKIVQGNDPLIQQVNRDKNEAMTKIFDESRQKIREVLTPEQQPKYDQFMNSLRERWEKKCNRGHRGPPPADEPPRR